MLMERTPCTHLVPPAAALPPKIVKKRSCHQFVEMAELKADIWPDDEAMCKGLKYTVTQASHCSEISGHNSSAMEGWEQY